MPAWANPQSIQFSIPQWLTQFVDPVTAVQWTFIIAAAAGASGAFVLLKSAFRTSTASALLGAILFLFNGFFSRRMLSGHLAFHTAMWTPWVAWLLLREQRSRREALVCTSLAGMIVAFMIHGGLVVLLPPLVLVWITLGLLIAFRGRPLLPPMLHLVAALGLGAALSASKLTAMAALAAQFPRNYYPLPGFQGLQPLFSTFFTSLFLRPHVPEREAMVNDIIHPAEHEWDFGISPVPVLLLLIALPFLVRAFRRNPRRSVPLLLGLGLLLGIPLAVNLYTPGWNALLKRTPIISSNSMLIRWFYYYVPVVPVLTASALDLLPARRILAAAGICLAVAWGLTAEPTTNESRFLRYDPATILKGWTRAHREETIPRIELMSARLRPDGTAPTGIFSGDDLVALGADQVFCYEPLFGYELEKLPWRGLHDGPALDETNGQLNVKNPACDLYPKENRCLPGSLFLSAQRLDAEAFLDWNPLPFHRSRIQVVADVLNVVVVGALAVFLLTSGLSWLRKRSQEG
jgi:hypothetical protein